MSTVFISLLTAISFAVLGSANEEAVQEVQGGFSLASDWDRWWLRIQDRHGRPDPGGPVQQRFDAPLYPKYQFDLAIPRFPLASERAFGQWGEAGPAQSSSARMWVQSLDEFELANVLQVRTEAPLWEDGYLGLRFDRRATRTHQSDVARIDFGHRDIADLGLDVAVRFFPRWEKVDADLELITRYRVEDLGAVTARIIALDPFTNASFGLVAARGRVLEEELRQLDLPLGGSLELRTEEFLGLRAEAYLGGVTPTRTRHGFPNSPEDDHIRTTEALLWGSMIEWRLPAIPGTSTRVPVSLGASWLSVSTSTAWDYAQRPDDDLEILETTQTARLYAIARPYRGVHLEMFWEHTLRPEEREWLRDPERSTRRDDREHLWSLRALWMPTTIVGAELGLLRYSRQSSGEPRPRVDGINHRLLTRLALQLGPNVWTAFGVNWDLDPGNVYDGGGMTMIIDF